VESKFFSCVAHVTNLMDEFDALHFVWTFWAAFCLIRINTHNTKKTHYSQANQITKTMRNDAQTSKWRELLGGNFAGV